MGRAALLGGQRVGPGAWDAFATIALVQVSQPGLSSPVTLPQASPDSHESRMGMTLYGLHMAHWIHTRTT